MSVVGDDGPNREADAESDQGRGWFRAGRRRRSVIDGRRISGDIHHRRIGRLNLNDLVGDINHLLFNDPLNHGIGHDHDLLRAGLERAARLRFGPQ